jgi:hypothetical protein
MERTGIELVTSDLELKEAMVKESDHSVSLGSGSLIFRRCGRGWSAGARVAHKPILPQIEDSGGRLS